MAEGTVHEGKIRRVKRILYPLVKIIAYAGSSAEGYPTEIKIFFFLFLIDKSEFVERFPEFSLFYRLFSPLDSEMICIFPYFYPCEESAREIREIFI